MHLMIISPTSAPGCIAARASVRAIALFGVQQGTQARQERFQVRVSIAQASQVPP